MADEDMCPGIIVHRTAQCTHTIRILETNLLKICSFVNRSAFPFRA